MECDSPTEGLEKSEDETVVGGSDILAPQISKD